MIIEDKIVGANETQFFCESLKASAERNKGDQPANLILKFEGGELIEQGFAGLRFDDNFKQLMPLVEIGQWKDLILVMGVKRWLIFKSDPPKPLRTIDLYRKRDEDTGFYRVTFNVCEQLLLAVYEGGVLAMSTKGDVLWHRKKHWDDELLQIEGKRLVFLSEAGERFALNCENGNDMVAN